MIEFSLRATKQSTRDIGRVFDRLERFVNDFAPEAFVVGMDAWIHAVDEKFATEGPGWPDLAPSTVRERSHLLGPGFGAHPILERFGYLHRSLTDWMMGGPQTVSYPTWSEAEGEGQKSIRTGNEIKTYMGLGRFIYRWLIYDERFETLMVDRPMIPLGTESEALCQKIEETLAELAAKMGAP